MIVLFDNNEGGKNFSGEVHDFIATKAPLAKRCAAVVFIAHEGHILFSSDLL